VKRSGYAYRHYKDFFLKRYGIITTKQDTDPLPNSISELVQWISSHVDGIASDEFEEGKTKIFVRNPETIYALEEILYKRTDPEGYAMKVKEYKNREKLAKQAQKGRGGLKPKCSIQ